MINDSFNKSYMINKTSTIAQSMRNSFMKTIYEYILYRKQYNLSIFDLIFASFLGIYYKLNKHG